MRRLIRRPAFWGIIALWGVFLPAMFFLRREDLFEILYAMCVSIGTGIIISFMSGAWRSLRSNLGEPMTAGDVLVLGIFFAWTGVVGMFSFWWLFRITGVSALRNHPLVAFFLWVLVTGGFFHLAASGSVDGRVPLASYRRVGIVAAAGLSIGLIIISLGWA